MHLVHDVQEDAQDALNRVDMPSSPMPCLSRCLQPVRPEGEVRDVARQRPSLAPVDAEDSKRAEQNESEPLTRDGDRAIIVLTAVRCLRCKISSSASVIDGLLICRNLAVPS